MGTHAMQHREVALATFNTLRDLHYFFLDNAERLTCGEVEALAELYLLAGLDPESLLDSHADGDDEGDQHYQDRGE